MNHLATFLNRCRGRLFILVGIASLASCVGSVDTIDRSGTEDPGAPPPGSTVGGEDNTFDHDNSGIDPFDLLERIAEEGPPKYSARMHGCTKMRYETLGNVLTSLGVNLSDTTDGSAGELYTSGYNAMGGANYAARVRENIAVTTSSASRMFDIFAAAAPEIIANLSAQPRCQVDSVGPEMFDVDGNCTEAGVTCLIGVPATEAHMELCNLTVAKASTPEIGQTMAVATLLAAAHTCE